MYHWCIKLKINSGTDYIDKKIGKIVDTIHATFKNHDIMLIEKKIFLNKIWRLFSESILNVFWNMNTSS